MRRKKIKEMSRVETFFKKKIYSLGESLKDDTLTPEEFTSILNILSYIPSHIEDIMTTTMLNYIITHPVCTDEQVIVLYKQISNYHETTMSVQGREDDYILKRKKARLRMLSNRIKRLIFTFKPRIAVQLDIKNVAKTMFKRQRQKTEALLTSIVEINQMLKTPEGIALGLTSTVPSLRQYTKTIQEEK